MKKRLWLIAAVLMCVVMAVAVSAETDGYYTYEVTDGEATITDANIPIGVAYLTVPATLGGYPVTTIGLRALNDLTNVHAVEISSGIQKIEGQAFSGARYLEYVKIPDSVKQIGQFPFAMCDNLCAIEVDPENPYYTSQDDVLFSKDMTELICYPPMKADTSYIVPDEVEYFADAAFCNCHNFTSIILPENLRYMGYRCFENCDGLTSIYIPEYVEFIGDAFQSCGSLTEINVDENNPYFCSIDGALIELEPLEEDNVPARLYVYPAAKSAETYTVPDTVWQIFPGAFSDCDNLKTVILRENMEYIGDRVCMGCDNLTSVTIPPRVTFIGFQAFRNCPNLTIYGYTGSTAETYANDNSIPFVALCDITLALTTYGDAADVTIQLLVDDEVIRTETVPNTTGTASFTITGVAPGSYTIRVSKPNHVSRSYSVTVQ